ncbi:hypothetical protein JCM18899A_32770 [Nocardioides sp. AN3]
MLVGFARGDGASYEHLPAPMPEDADRRRETVLAGLARAFGPEALEPIGYHEMNWTEERWTTGCVPIWSPGLLADRDRQGRLACARSMSLGRCDQPATLVGGARRFAVPSIRRSGASESMRCDEVARCAAVAELSVAGAAMAQSRHKPFECRAPPCGATRPHVCRLGRHSDRLLLQVQARNRVVPP